MFEIIMLLGFLAAAISPLLPERHATGATPSAKLGRGNKPLRKEHCPASRRGKHQAHRLHRDRRGHECIQAA